MAKRGLGKGLDSMLSSSAILSIDSSESIVNLKLTEVEPNKNQPRKSFDAEKLQILADSLKEHGVISPIVVTKKDGYFEIVAGERRWRAAKLAGLKEIPAIVREYTPQTLCEVALIENIQREDLNPIEEAGAYRALMEEFSLTQDEIAEKIGRSRSAVANAVRLLSLEPEIQKLLISGEISEGHARCILSLKSAVLREFLAKRIVDDGLNVRQAERLAKDLAQPKKDKAEAKTPDAAELQIERIRKHIEDKLGTKVRINHTAKKGKIEIEYYGNSDLDRLLVLLSLN